MITNLFYLGSNSTVYNDKTFYKGMFLDNETSETLKLGISEETFNKLSKIDRFTNIKVQLIIGSKGYDTIVYSCELV